MVLIIVQRFRIMILKSTYGVTAVLSGSMFKKFPKFPYTGSSLNRRKKPTKKKQVQLDEIANLDRIQAFSNEIEQKKVKKERSMSPRTKSKIRRKIIAFSQLNKRLSFLTLTFVNKVEDEKAVIVLRKFLDNIKKTSKDFQYLWVAEKQTKNEVFKDNIHFHLITNKYWDIKKGWAYWHDLQKKNGIFPREENYKASSGFDIKGLLTKEIKSVTSYLTKYVTKNKSVFNCQVWNCSKKISALYTDFYSDYSFLEVLKNIEGIEIKEISSEYCNLHLVPLNSTTMPYYEQLKEKNKKQWNKK